MGSDLPRDCFLGEGLPRPVLAELGLQRLHIQHAKTDPKLLPQEVGWRAKVFERAYFWSGLVRMRVYFATSREYRLCHLDEYLCLSQVELFKSTIFCCDFGAAISCCAPASQAAGQQTWPAHLHKDGCKA